MRISAAFKPRVFWMEHDFFCCTDWGKRAAEREKPEQGFAKRKSWSKPHVSPWCPWSPTKWTAASLKHHCIVTFGQTPWGHVTSESDINTLLSTCSAWCGALIFISSGAIVQWKARGTYIANTRNVQHMNIFNKALNKRCTCVVASVHSTVMVAHGVEVVQIVVGKDGLCRLELFSGGLLPRLLPGSRVQILHALTPLHHMGGHVQSSHRETHQGGELVPPLANLLQRFTSNTIQHQTPHTSLSRLNWITQLP